MTSETRNSKVENGTSATVRESQSVIVNRQLSIALPLLLEVGCEEIPARFLAQAQKDLGERVKVALEEARLVVTKSVDNCLESGGLEPRIPSHESLAQTYSTPRRLIVHVPQILARQPDKSEEVMGPPVKVAADAAGNYTRAAESFAQKNSANVDDLIRVATPKGEYLALKKTTAGRLGLEVLREILPGVITGMSFPKSMYWEKSGVRFVRPIRWIVALLGEGSAAQVVPFEVAGVKSGDKTYGHRLAGSQSIAVAGFKDFGEKLRGANVEFDPESRRQTIQNELNVLLEEDLEAEVSENNEAFLEAVPNSNLEDWIVNSTEWASGILGKFNDRFLHLPREILITVMRDHQKYFAVQDSQGKLQPHFIALLGRDRDATGTIQAGHERVLTARFSDAEFFWNADQKVRLRDRVPMLERVTYQAKLGSYGDKVRRMAHITFHLGAQLQVKEKLWFSQQALLQGAVELCKCDLTTQMVQEFPELQGVVGGLYASAQGEPQEVADAIYDHYLPQGAEGECPRSLIGAVVSLADKIDSIVAAFAVGHEPTGSGDPFGLRRQGNAIVKLMVEYKLPISFPDLEWTALQSGLLIEGQPNAIQASVDNFLRERLRFYMNEIEKWPYDTVRGVLAANVLLVPIEMIRRAEAFEQIRHTEDFEALCAGAKRIRNILTKSGVKVDSANENIEESLLTELAEQKLYQALSTVGKEGFDLTVKGRYAEALEKIASLRPAVDEFFEKVLVMSEDSTLRQNRLRLLWKLDHLFSGTVELSGIARGDRDEDEEPF